MLKKINHHLDRVCFVEVGVNHKTGFSSVIHLKYLANNK